MKKNLIILVFLLTYCGLNAQYFQKEAISIGTNIGLMNEGAIFGLRGEYGLTDNIGLGFDLNYSSYSEDYSSSISNNYDINEIDYKKITFLVTGLYHFMPNSKIDPYVRLGLGYTNYSTDYSSDISLPVGIPNFNISTSSDYGSGLTAGIEAGLRFHIGDVFSFRTSVGYPNFFNTGFDITFNRPELTEEQKLKQAEEDAKNKDNPNYALYFGYYLGANVSTVYSVPQSRLFSPNATAPDAGFSLYVPFGTESSVGFLLNAGYSQTAFSTYPLDESNDSNTIKETYEFITIQPSLYLGGFIIGMKIGLPKSAKAENTKDDKNEAIIVKRYDEDSGTFSSLSNTNDSYIETQFDVVIGGSITLVNSSSGKLKLNIMGSYPLKALYKDYKNYLYAYNQKIEKINTPSGGSYTRISYDQARSKYNPTPISISIGLSYLFKLGF